jgi:rhamnulokinase
MQEVIATGSVLGNLSKNVGSEIGLKELPVIAVASHDTGSAVAAVPSEGENWVYISSGTWSLMGIESKIPIISEKTLNLNFTNEGGVEGTFRILKNITGLWLLQACRRSWVGERSYTYPELIDAAKSAAPFQFLLDPDRNEFLNPQDMPEAIRQVCIETEEHIPEAPADFSRGILESLAFKYRYILQQIQQISSHPVDEIHIIGGGAQNQLLCQFTADATGVPVLAGPIEATAIGNIMVQALTLGYVASMAEMRKVIRNSFKTLRYEPQNTQSWDAQYERFLNLLKI